MSRPPIELDRAERTAILRALERALAAQPEVAFAYVHGSFLSARPFRDVDVAVYLKPDSERGSYPFAQDLAAILEGALAGRAVRGGVPLPVDVRILNEAPLGFRYHAFRGELVFSRDEALRSRVVERTASRYLDFEPLLRQALKEAMTA